MSWIRNRGRLARLVLVPVAAGLVALGAWPAGAQTSQPSGKKEAAAEKGSKKYAAGTMPVKPKTPPQHIQVQHILIAFEGSLPNQTVGRTKDDAKKLAYEVLEQARMGASFDTLVKKYTNDQFPGVYGMANTGVTPAQGEYPRSGMVAAFGNIGFELSPGNIGIADYDPRTSPYGWHIIKRLK